MFANSFQSSPVENIFNESTQTINSHQNIIAGPNEHEYWWHSGGYKQPLEREEQGFPPQGNIGALVKQEALGQYKNCNHDPNNSIGGSPNCTSAFEPDYYTTNNTCGKDCFLESPEIFGDKHFGLIDKALQTSIHSLHAYENVRAGAAGQDTAGVYGEYEWIPKTNKQGTYVIPGYDKPYAQVGDWLSLPETQSLVDPAYGTNNDAPASAPSSR